MNYGNIIEKMTLFEKASLMSGKNIWQTHDFPHLDIPSLFLSDGPHGIRKQLGSADHLGLNKSIPATCFPTAATIANSWDVELAEEIGEALGTEARELGVNVLLGPGLNIKRNPLCGRNFEYFSEDPLLTGKMSTAYIKGIQNKGVAASPKHFAVNSQELRRMSNDSIIDERTLREIYLPGFEASVIDGQTQFIMTAYNKINGEYANEHHHLLQEILYGEWNYQGAVVTDWGGSNDHVLGVEKGSHLEMPGTGVPGALEIKEAVEAGRLSEDLLNQRVDELLTVIFKLANKELSADALAEETIYDHHELAYKAALDSTVLLKNEQSILPIKATQNIALVGDFVNEPRYQGAGSSLVNPTQLESIGIVTENIQTDTIRKYQGFTRKDEINQDLVDEAVSGAQSADVVIVFAGLPEIAESEGMDRTEMKLPSNQQHLIESLAKENSNIVVVLAGGSPIEMPWIDKVSAVVHTYLAGQAGGRAIWDILTGLVSPSGKLNESYPLVYEDTPSYNYYPGEQVTSEYKESIFVGYRYYETANVPVRFPFGFGLSYTQFKYENLEYLDNSVTFDLTNIGDVPASEIAQVYVSMNQSNIFRSKKELVGFSKIHLNSGETKRVSIKLDKRAFEFYNPKAKRWEVEAGEYTIQVAESSQKSHLTHQVVKEGVLADDIYDVKILEQYQNANVKEVSDIVFEELVGFPLPDKLWNTSRPLESNDTLSQMYYADSWLARRAYHIITYFLNRSMRKGKPNLNLFFNYNMTFRAMAKMTGGIINQKMVNEILNIVNGSFWSGTRGLVSAYFDNRSVTKKEREND